MNNIIFIYGDDNYHCFQALAAIKQKYMSANLGDTNLAELDGSSVSADEFVRQIRAFPFLAPKRLVILKDLLSGKNKTLQEQLPEILTKVPETTLLVIYDPKPDKRTTLFKTLTKSTLVKEFPALKDFAVKKWIRSFVIKHKGNIESDAIDLLFEWFGSDLWQLHHEIEKLLAYNPTITSDAIRALSQSAQTETIFILTDQILARNRQRALQLLDTLRTQGEADLQIFGLLSATVRNLASLRIAQSEGITNPKDQASKTKIHPFVISKLTRPLQTLSLGQIRQIYKKLVDIDFAIKTGKIDPGTALDLVVVELT